MRLAAAVAVAALATTCLVAPSQATAADRVDTSRVRQAVTVEGIMAHERALQAIATANGGSRESGTPGFAASADYVAGVLRKAGYRVQRQTFTFPYFRELAPATLSEVSPTARTFETATFTYSGSGDVTGELVPTNDVVIPPTPDPSGSSSGCEASDFVPAPSPTAIALAQRGTCTFGTKADNAAAAGYAALVVFNEGQPGRDGLIAGTLGSPRSLPVVGLSFADGAALYAETQTGPVTAHVVTSTENDPNRTTENVIADSPAGKYDSRTLVVGAHLDSVPAGPGINDDGSGVSTNLEIAEQLAALKYTKHLRRPVRFAFWGAEELGLLGSTHYVSTLSEAQRASILANLNFDMLASPNYVRFVYDGDGSDTPDAGPAGSDVIEQVFTSYFDGQHLASEPTAFDGRSDYGPFIAADIPAGGLFSGAEGIKTADEAASYGGTAGEPYDACYHQACDGIGNLSAQALDELGDGAAHAVLTLAMAKDPLGDGGRARPHGQARGQDAPDHRGHDLQR